MASARELIVRRGKKFFARRSQKTGRFKGWVAMGRSLVADRRQRAKRSVPSGQGDRGDRKRR